MTSPPKSSRICLGKITAPHGIKGLVKILAYGEDPTLIETIDQIFTGQTSQKTLSITLKNPMGKYFLATVKDYDTREKVEEIKGTELWVDRDALPELIDKDEFYIEDLSNLTVLNTKKEKIGTTTNIQNYGAGNLLEIKPNAGATYFVPFQNEYIHDIDLKERCITIKNAESFIIE